jgi:hypothetical protein
MKSKEWPAHPAPMNPATRPLNSRSRDRAVDRIRALTMGTAIVGFAASGAFGALAAVTYAGTSTPNGTGSSNAGTTSNDVSGSTGDDGAGSGTTSNTGQVAYPPFQPVQAPTHQSSHHGHATSGGSGG